MRDYRFCVALRRADGVVDEPMREERISAKDAADAIALAKDIDVDMVGLRANAIYLVGPDGHVVWSLRLADVCNIEV